jgi:hypothetical protein
MRTKTKALWAGFAILLTGCAIRPMPEDVTGVSTYTIVRQIRCETRQTIVDSAIGWLTAEGNEDRVDSESRAIGFQFANGRPIQELKPELFKGRVRSIVKLFFDTGVAYNFELEMTETNNLKGEINFLKLFDKNKGTLNAKAGADRTRKNNRTFTVTDTFSGLVGLHDAYCDGRAVGESYSYVARENYIYPITGKIGVQRLVQDFINLTLFANLAGRKEAPKGPPTLADILTFETTISGTVAPKITFTPGKSFSVADASLTGDASRKDMHKITMALAIAEADQKLVGPIRSGIFTTNLLTASPATNAEFAAAEAVNQALTLKLFNPTIIVTP